MKQFNNFLQRGFSLVEILVFVTLIGIIGAVTTQVFIIAVRSQGKSEIAKEVKQSGDYAMSVMESMIRNASDIPDIPGVDDCNYDVQELTILNQDGGSTTFDCNPPQIASNSQRLTSEKVEISDCHIRIVCPTPPLSPKYVYINYTVSQVGSGLPPDQVATVEYQSTVSLRNYE